MTYLKNLIQILKKRKVIFKGCSENEIKNIQNIIIPGRKFPQCYHEFLIGFGKYMEEDFSESNPNHGSLIGEAIFLEDLIDNNNENGLTGLLEEDEADLSPSNIFVFYGSQGVLYAFFKLDDGDNPPIYAYQEGFSGSDFPQVSNSLSSFLERKINGDKSLFKELVNS